VSGLVPSCGAGEFCCKSKNSYSALSSDTLTDRFVPNTTPLNAWSDSKFDSNKDSNTLYGILQTMPLDSKGNACSSSNQNSNGDANWGSIAPSGFDLFYDCGRIPPAAIQSNVQSGIVFNSNGSAQHEIICLANTEIPKG
jgi:hypothetical protein